jgi:hypothetical protein
LPNVIDETHHPCKARERNDTPRMIQETKGAGSGDKCHQYRNASELRYWLTVPPIAPWVD